MGKGRKRAPTRIQEQKGAYIKHPERRNKSEPQPRAGEPVCPEDIRNDEHGWSKWCELVVLLDDMRLLTVAEVDVMAAYCRSYSQLMAADACIKRDGHVIASETKWGVTMKRNPACQEYWSAMQSITRLMPELGLTPSGRAKLHAQTDKTEEDPLVTLLKVS